MVLLAFARFRDKDSKGLQRCADNVRHVLERNASSRRIRRFGHLIDVLGLMLGRQVARVLEELRAMAREAHQPDFDIEAALNMVSLLSELAAAELQLEEASRWIDTIAMRFCVSKSLSELLAKAAGAHPPYAEQARAAHAKVIALAESAMNHSLNGEPHAAVKALLAHGAQTQNTKLIDMARMVLQRHAEKISDAVNLHAMADELHAKLATAGMPGFGTGQRQSGGVALRAAASPDPETPRAQAKPAELPAG